MHRKTSIALKMLGDYDDKMVNFHKFFISACKKWPPFELDHIRNVEEVSLMFDILSSISMIVKESKTIAIKTTDYGDHYIVVLSCCTDGTKLPPFLIFNRKTILEENILKDAHIHVYLKGWMDEAGMHLWLCPGGLLCKPTLLVWGQFRVHKTETIIKNMIQLKTEIVVIPGGLMSLLQPLDVSLNRPFKQNMKEQWSIWMTMPDHDLISPRRMERPSIAQVCEWVKLGMKLDQKLWNL